VVVMVKKKMFIGFLLGALCLPLFAAAPKITIDKVARALVDQAMSSVDQLDTLGLQAQLKQHPETVLIDVRTNEEIKRFGGIGVYQNHHLARGWLEFRITDLVPNKSTPIVVYCGTNLRSPLAAKNLLELGYSEVKNYKDGYFAWQEAGLDVKLSDVATDSFLYRRPKKVIEGVYSAIGAPQPSTYENSGHNNNLSFVIADDGVVVFNAGGSYFLAQSMHQEIKKVTNLAVKYVVLENAQGHAILGSSYWKEQGAEIIAHEHTAEIIQHILDSQSKESGESVFLTGVKKRLKDKAERTTVVMPDRTFRDKLILPLAGRKIELLHLGSSHGPDDIQLWLPKERLVITGDFTFNERLLPVLAHTDVRKWLANWPKLVALNPAIVIPGHGDVTDMATVTYFTKNYLEYMLGKILALVDEGGTLMEAYGIDQSQFMHWKTFRELSRLNADRLFRRYEFE